MLLLSPALQAAPQVKHWALDNGAQVYLVESDVLPMLDVHIAFDAGSSRDPAGKEGLAAMAALMADKGIMAGKNNQQPAMDENEITEAWLDLGAIFSVDNGRDEFSYSLRTLTLPDVLPSSITLASRMIASPSFPAEVFTRDQARVISNLKENLTKPATIASRQFASLVFGEHSYGAQRTEKSLSAIQVADLKTFHQNNILPCKATVSMVGHVTQEQANQIAQNLLAELPQPKVCPVLPEIHAVKPLSEAIHEEIPFDAAQAQIYIGQPGIQRDDPDFITLVVANHILGGNGFSSRLMQEVREDRGLTYGIGSWFSPGKHAGAFTISLKTRPDQAQEALQISMQVLKDFVEQGPTQKELDAAKANLLGGFPLMYDSNSKLLSQVANIGRNHLPLDYLDQWPQMIEAVTIEDIKQAMQRVIQPNRMVTLVLGGEKPTVD